MSERKMNLLETAHGLLCNAAQHESEDWKTAFRDWMSDYESALRHHRTKRHNKRIAVGNEAITKYEGGNVS